jgi:hypothetical protein
MAGAKAPIDPVALAACLADGKTQGEAAVMFGVKQQTIRRHAASPEVMAEIEAIQADAREAAKRHGRKLIGQVMGVYRDALAADRPAGLCSVCKERTADPDPDHAIRVKAADSVADRFGLPKTEVTEMQGALMLSDKSDADLERVTLEEAARILDERGQHEPATAIRAVLGG